MDVKIILDHLVSAGRKAYKLDRKMHDIGYDHNPYFEIYGEIADAVYNILGERCIFEESATAMAFANQHISDAQCADGLFTVYQHRNEPAELSGATMRTLQEEADRKGIQVQNMINIILAEWALRQEYIRGIAKAV